MIAPGQETTGNNLSKPMKLIPEVGAGLATLIVYGRVTYESEGLCYFTNFCSVSTNLGEAVTDVQTAIAMKTENPKIRPVNMMALPYGNEAT